MIVCNLCGTAVSGKGIACNKCSGSGVERSTHLRGLLTPSQQKGSPDRWAKRYMTPPSTPPSTASSMPPATNGTPAEHKQPSTATLSPLGQPIMAWQDTLDIAIGPDNVELARVYGSVLSPSVQHPTCASCDTVLNLGTKIFLAKHNVNGITAGDSLCRGCFASLFALGSCCGCGKAIVGDAEEGHGGRHVKGSLDKLWHAACFRCAVCAISLYPPTEVDHQVQPSGKPVCAACIERKAHSTPTRLPLSSSVPRLNINSRFPLPGQSRRELWPVATVNREFAVKRWSHEPVTPSAEPRLATPTRPSAAAVPPSPGASVRDRIAKLNADAKTAH